MHLVVREQPAPPVELSGLHVLLGGMAALGKMSRLCEAYGDPALFASWRASLADNPHAVLRVTTASPTVMPGRGDCFQFYVKSHAGRQLLSIAQQFHVTQCFGGMSHCNLFRTLTLYLMLSHVLDFGGTL